MKFMIITGYSRGIGRQLAEVSAEKQGERLGLIAISRRANAELDRELNASCLWYRSVRGDLADHSIYRALTGELTKLCDQFFAKHGTASSVELVNNAAVLGPLQLLSSLWRDDGRITEAAHALQANSLAPALLSGWFAGQFQQLETPAKRIINISSGASKGPMPGAALYSMSKAALNMASLSIAAEQKESIWPVKAYAISPGMVETNMQEIIRSKESDDFPEVEFFRNASRDGQVRDARQVAEAILSLDFEKLESGGYYHIRDLISGSGASGK